MAENGWEHTYRRTNSLIEQTVGIIGLGTISRYLIKYLEPFDCKIKLFSNHTSDEEAAELGVEKVSLEEMLRVSGGAGYSQKEGLLSAKNLGFDKGATSDDLLMVGIEGPVSDIKIIQLSNQLILHTDSLP